MNQLDPTKASIENDLPIKILIGNSDIVCSHLSNIYNSKNDNIYPQTLKLADVTPIHNKDETTSMKNYRPVSLIPIVSKLFERDMYKQIIRKGYVQTNYSKGICTNKLFERDTYKQIILKAYVQTDYSKRICTNSLFQTLTNSSLLTYLDIGKDITPNNGSLLCWKCGKKHLMVKARQERYQPIYQKHLIA